MAALTTAVLAGGGADGASLVIAAHACIAQVLGYEPGRIRPIGRGNDTEILAVSLADGRALVAKAGSALKGLMLRYVVQHSPLPMPEVFHAEAGLLLMSSWWWPPCPISSTPCPISWRPCTVSRLPGVSGGLNPELYGVDERLGAL